MVLDRYRSKLVLLIALSWIIITGVSCSTPKKAVFVDRSNKQEKQLARAAMDQVGKTITYSMAYVPLSYPGGGVPTRTGACTDVVIRAFRKMGIDLQVAVHEDMKTAFSQYPQDWGLALPDANIDHRRVPNLQSFFKRQGKELPVTDKGSSYLPGDIVAWQLGSGNHIGMVSTEIASDGQRYKIVHNIGSGAKIEDRLFAYKIIGHYRYY